MKVNISDFKKDNSGRDTNVEISTQDIWNLDHTLALIIHPALTKLKESKAGAPFVDEEDVPENLRMSEIELKEFYDGSDNQANWFKKWEYVLDEMIWAFNEIANEEEPLLDYNSQQYKDYYKSLDDGLRLFGKYYRSLWT